MGAYAIHTNVRCNIHLNAKDLTSHTAPVCFRSADRWLMLFLLNFLEIRFIFSYIILCQNVSNFAVFLSAETVNNAAC